MRAGAMRWGRGQKACQIVGFLVVVGALLGGLAIDASAQVGDYRCGDPSRVYHGNPRLIRKPAVISADDVYSRISEYRQICEQGLTDKDVRYHFLMKKASERFAKAVKATARALGYDCVAEQGAIEPAREDVDDPADATAEVISRLG